MSEQNNIRVIAIGPQRFISANGFTGDATQMKQTVHELKKMDGYQITTAFYISPEELITDFGESLKWEDLHKAFHLAHIFTLLPSEYASIHKHLAKLPTVLSTVYWNFPFRDVITIRNGGHFRRIFLSLKHLLYQKLGIKKNSVGLWCKGILPNSWSEGSVFTKEYALTATAVCMPVPNAIDLPENIQDLPRPSYLPKSDYVVCPGAFAYRKNQLSIVRAMKGSGIPIVFMGKPYPDTQNMFDKCINEADENMHFIGYKSSEDKEYWAVLKHAKAAILASDCETPGIALLEAAAVGARPIVTIQGGTQEYYGLVAEYLNPFSKRSIRQAITNAWARGRLSETETKMFHKFTWKWTAELTEKAYRAVLNSNK